MGLLIRDEGGGGPGTCAKGRVPFGLLVLFPLLVAEVASGDGQSGVGGVTLKNETSMMTSEKYYTLTTK